MGEAPPLTESEVALLVLDGLWLALQSSQKGSGEPLSEGEHLIH